MSRSSSGQGEPRAVVHKRILQAAENQPEAAVETLAADISGASVDLVERVLEEYGDPNATDEADGPSEPTDGSSVAVDSPADPEAGETATQPQLEELSQTQLETLRAVFDRPSATQAEIGELLGVSPATVSARLRDIAGFDWQDRGEYVADLFEPRVLSDGDGQAASTPDQAIAARLSAIEDRLDAMETDDDGVLGADLVHKVIHACMESEQLSDAEELEVIRALM